MTHQYSLFKCTLWFLLVHVLCYMTQSKPNIQQIVNPYQSKCEPGLYGANCSHVCPCENNATCDPITGFCDCSAGYIGTNCTLECQNGTYGKKCLQECKCNWSNTVECDKNTGECICHTDYFGPECNSKCSCVNGYCNEQGTCHCNNEFYGPKCDKKYNCITENTIIFNQEIEKCLCKHGWEGRICDQKTFIPKMKNSYIVIGLIIILFLILIGLLIYK